jgi:hydrogenase maturation protease
LRFRVSGVIWFSVVSNFKKRLKLGRFRRYNWTLDREHLKNMTNKNEKQIMVLGVGNLIFTDEGVGIHVIRKLEERYGFPENVSIQDGGVLGINLLGVISAADHLIVVDAVKNGGRPGDLHRLEGKEIPKRILAKNSLHQVDLLEALTLCQALDKVPETVILGVEPKDIESVGLELTPVVQEKLDNLIDMVLEELDRLGIVPSPLSEIPV